MNRLMRGPFALVLEVNPWRSGPTALRGAALELQAFRGQHAATFTIEVRASGIQVYVTRTRG